MKQNKLVFHPVVLTKMHRLKKGIFRYYSVPVLSVVVVGQQLCLLVALCFSLLNKHIFTMFWTIFLEVRLITANGPRNDLGTTSQLTDGVKEAFLVSYGSLDFK